MRKNFLSMRRPVGWRYESVRHALAAKGIRTGGYYGRRYMVGEGPRKMGEFTVEEVSDGRFKVIHKDGWVGEFSAVGPMDAYSQGFGRWKQQRKAEEEVEAKERESKAKAEREKVAGGAQAEKFSAEAAKARQEVELGGLTREAAERAAKREKEREAVEGSLPYKTSQAIRGGSSTVSVEGKDISVDEAMRRLRGDALHPGAYDGAVRELGAKAVQYAQSGQELSKELFNRLPALQQAAVKKELADFKERTTGTKEAIGRAAKATLAVGLGEAELGAKAVKGLVGATAKGVGAEIAMAEEGLQGKGGGFFDDNPLLSDKFQGQFKPLKDIEGKESMGMLSEDLLGPKALGGKRKTFNEAVDDEVNELAEAKKHLAKVDLMPFKKGETAFEKGDREGLIGSINALEAQEQLIADRWNLVEQTRAVTLSPQARAQAYVQDNGPFGLGAIGLWGGGGGDVLAERTKKISEVKRSLKDAANELYARKKLLRYKLQRLDQAASIGDSSLPQGKIDILTNKKEGLIDELAEKNPVLHPVNTLSRVFGQRER